MNPTSSKKYISAREAKKQLSSLVKDVIAGDSFVITDDTTGEPIAELVPVIDEEVGLAEATARPNIVNAGGQSKAGDSEWRFNL